MIPFSAVNVVVCSPTVRFQPGVAMGPNLFNTILEDRLLAGSIMATDLPQGFIYQPDFLSECEEEELLRHVKHIQFSELRMRERIARRRVAHFGMLYSYDSRQAEPGPPIPDFLRSLAERAANLLQIIPEEWVEALVTEYPPGAPIGWHRDAPVFDTVIAISLLSPARLRLRYGSSGRAEASLVIEPRSAYVLQGEVRSKWQHSISPTKATRYSITFRTLRSKSKKPHNLLSTVD
jgi:alkylated DNA repair protein (DNA oxidative demethylase)